MRRIRLAPSRRHNGKPASRERRGFSLVEAIIAVVLLAFGVLALTSSSVMTIRTLKSSSQRVNDAALAATSFERLRSLEKCGIMTTKAASIPGMVAEQVANPGGATMLRLIYTLPVQAGFRATQQEYRSNVPCAL